MTNKVNNNNNKDNFYQHNKAIAFQTFTKFR